MFTYLKTSFNGGEFSPVLWNRPDIAKYSTGLKLCRNFIPTIYGSVKNRPGLYFVARQGDETEKARMIPFVFSEDEAYALEFGDHYVRFFKDHQQLVKSLADTDSWVTSTSYEVDDWVKESSELYLCKEAHTSGVFADDLAAGKWVQQEEYEITSPFSVDHLADLDIKSSADTIYICSGSLIVKKLIRSGSTSWAFSDYAPVDGPFLPENVDSSLTITPSAVTGSGVTLTSSSSLFASGHVGSLWKIVHFVEGQIASTAFTATGQTSSISCFTTWRLITHGTWAAKFNVEMSTDGGTTWNIIRSFSGSSDFNPDTYGTEDVEIYDEPFLVRVNVTSYSSGTLNVDLSTDSFFQEGIARITAVTSGTSATATILKDLASTAATYSWAEGAWSDYRGYPSAAAFHEDRLVTGGTNSEAERRGITVDMSQTAAYESYGKNQFSLLDTDAISVNLLSRQINPITALVPLGDLVILTTGSEWLVGSDSGVMTPKTTRAKVQGYRGAKRVQPVVIGNQIVFVQNNGKTIRNLFYSDDSKGYTGSDIRILTEHLFKGRTVIDMAYQQDPDSLIWIVLDNGDLLSCTYLYEQEVVAWAKHPTNGEVESICVIPSGNYDELWITVNRANGRFVERMVERMSSDDVQDQFFVDSGLTYDSPVTITGITSASPGVVTAASHGFSDDDLIDFSDIVGMTELNGHRYKVASATTNTFEITDEESGDDVDTSGYGAYSSGGYARKAEVTFSGLGHLEGQTVAILGNGDEYAQQEVSGGEVTISRACSRAHIGLPYVCDISLLDVYAEMRTGPTLGKKVKIVTATMCFNESRGGFIGPDEDSLYEAFTQNRYSVGTPPPLRTGKVRAAIGGDFSDSAGLFFRQTSPLPVEITGIAMECDVGG